MRNGLKLTPEVHEELVRLTTAGLTIAASAKQVGISARTFEQWLQKGRCADAEEPYASFAMDIERALSTCEFVLLSRIQKAAAGGDWKAAAWIMERKYKETWATHEPKKHTTINVLAVQAGISADQVHAAIADGRIPGELVGHGFGAPFIRDREAALEALGAGAESIDKTVDDGGAPSVASIEKARLDRHRALADKAQLEVERLRRDYVNVVEAQQQMQTVVDAIDQRLSQLPQQLAEDVARSSDPHDVAQLIDEAMRQALTELAGELSAEL
jgi:hypothetical protein